MSCKNNRNGELPSCIEAKFDGPGCEDWDLCSGCADTLKKQLDETNRLNGEMLVAIKEAVVLLHEKPRDAAVARLMAVLSKTEKRVDPVPNEKPTPCLMWKEHWLRAARFLKSWDAGSDNYSEGWHGAASHLEERVQMVDREPYTH